jgi:sec-independent protein translocase protein TatB
MPGRRGSRYRFDLALGVTDGLPPPWGSVRRRPPGMGAGVPTGLGLPEFGAKRAAHRFEDPFAPMFDFAWSEIALIAAVALVVIGPKDLPIALRAISGFVKKARRMAGEFQTHVDEMMRDADLKDVKDSLNQIRNFDFRGTVEKAIDPDHSLRNTFAGNPLEPSTSSGGNLGASDSGTGDLADGDVLVSDAAPDEHLPDPEPPPPVRVDAPAFIPPALVPFVEGSKPPPPPPPFIPPAAMLQRPPG